VRFYPGLRFAPTWAMRYRPVGPQPGLVTCVRFYPGLRFAPTWAVRYRPVGPQQQSA